MNTMQDVRIALRGLAGKCLALDVRNAMGREVLGISKRLSLGEAVSDAALFSAFRVSETAIDALNEQAARMAAPMVMPSGGNGKSIAVMQMSGVATFDFEYQPFVFSTQLMAQNLNALAGDESIGTIIVISNTPGGQVTGTPECSDALWNARQAGKKVVGVVNPLCASAGYWILSGANEIVATPSADTGSVGCFMEHDDYSGMLEQVGVKVTFIVSSDSPYKTEGNPYQALSDEARARYQSEVDAIMAQFAKAISRGRSLPVATVLSDFGKGRCLMSGEAKKANMIDRVATLDVALGRLGVTMTDDESRRGRRRGEAAEQAVTVTPSAEETVTAAITAEAAARVMPVAEPQPEEHSEAPAAQAQSQPTDGRAAQSATRARRIALLSA